MCDDRDRRVKGQSASATGGGPEVDGGPVVLS